MARLRWLAAWVVRGLKLSQWRMTGEMHNLMKINDGHLNIYHHERAPSTFHKAGDLIGRVFEPEN